ncbi:MAG: hypothetical protein H6718_05025 [Polyangiaceae bacterium]|nr:hypothetical protein [Myxococcales bacterium]MCB9584734.1 hypothetical protein [Polyangiaceae bacterium]MCB9607693.1 hypothetical protein [Polyangiaceae bacterium]
MGRRSKVPRLEAQRAALNFGVVAVLALTCDWARGAGVSVDQCLDASERGQRERDSGELKSARESFVTCSNQACPALVQKDCVAWLSDVQHRLPSVVLRVRDPEGNDVGEVQLRLDEARAGQTLDGNAVVMDPGKRVFHFERAGFESQSLEIVVREGEQARLVDVVLQPLAEPGGTPPRGVGLEDGDAGVPTLTWVLGGVGVLALGSYAYFGFQAKSERDDLDGCKPSCTESDVDSARSKWLISNVSFGVAVVAIGAAVWIGLDRPSADRAPTSRAGLTPTPGGAVGVFSTAF